MIREKYPTGASRSRHVGSGEVARRSRLPSDLAPRIAVALPAAAVLVALNHAGGAVFAVPVALIAALGHFELARLAGLGRAAAAPGAFAAAAIVVLALADGMGPLVGALVLGPVACGLAAAAAGRGRQAAAAAVTLAGIAWVGGCLAHAVALRELDDGAGLVIAVLLATFIGDTAAHLVGSAIGRRKLAPSISPAKTVEGLLAGIVAGTAACWAYGAAHLDVLSSPEALGLGLACALAAPAGDLLESAVKRRAGVKDSGRLFGAHGGVLDRVDAVLASALAGFYVVRALGVA